MTFVENASKLTKEFHWAHTKGFTVLYIYVYIHVHCTSVDSQITMGKKHLLHANMYNKWRNYNEQLQNISSTVTKCPEVYSLQKSRTMMYDE